MIVTSTAQQGLKGMTMGRPRNPSLSEGKNYPEVPGHDYQFSFTFSNATDLPRNTGSREKYSDLRTPTSQAWALGPAPGWPFHLPSRGTGHCSRQLGLGQHCMSFRLKRTVPPPAHKSPQTISNQIHCYLNGLWGEATQITLFGEININKWWSFLKGLISFEGW